MKTIWIVFCLFSLSCCSTQETLSKAGETCSKSSDCESGSRCFDSVCKDPYGVEQANIQDHNDAICDSEIMGLDGRTPINPCKEMGLCKSVTKTKCPDWASCDCVATIEGCGATEACQRFGQCKVVGGSCSM